MCTFQMEIGFGKWDSYTKLHKLGEVRAQTPNTLFCLLSTRVSNFISAVIDLEELKFSYSRRRRSILSGPSIYSSAALSRLLYIVYNTAQHSTSVVQRQKAMASDSAVLYNLLANERGDHKKSS